MQKIKFLLIIVLCVLIGYLIFEINESKNEYVAYEKVQKAIEIAEHGEFNAAKALLIESLDYHKLSVAYQTLGDMELFSQNYERALKYYTDAINTCGNTCSEEITIMQAYLSDPSDERNRNEISKLIEIAKKYTARDNNYIAYFQLGKYSLLTQDIENAKEMFLKAQESYTGDRNISRKDITAILRILN